MSVNTIEYPTVRWARELPNHPAVIVDHNPVSYRELEARITKCAAWLRSNDVAAGDRVVISGANSLAWITALHALARLGAVHVPIGPRILKFQADEYDRIYSPRITLSDQTSLHLWERSHSILECVNGEADTNCHFISGIDPDALHSIVQTSGSDGEPKGVCLSFRNHLSNAIGSAINLGVSPDDRWLLNLPMDRIGGLAIVIRAAVYGTSIVVHEQFDAQKVWQSIDEDVVTQLSLVSTTLRRVLDAAPGRRCPDCVRTVLIGGGPVPFLLLDEARERGFPILPTYGLTETASQIATLSPAAPKPKRYTTGFALALAEIVIRDDEGSDVPASTEGRIHVRGPMVSQGYWGTDGRITSAPENTGWLATNDIGAFDVEGYLQIIGRIDNVIISGGIKIHAEEIENALLLHDAIDRAVVIGVEDTEWGQTPLAFVELKPGKKQDNAHFLNFLAAKLPKQKRPRRLEILDAIPILPSGKPDRQSIRERYRT